MKPIQQTRVGREEGNCLAAAIASIFEIGIDDVPNLTLDALKQDEILRAWTIEKYKVYPIDIEIDFCKKSGLVPVGFHLINGPSMNIPDAWHTVVGHNGGIAFDPHPNPPALLHKRTYTIFCSTMEDLKVHKLLEQHAEDTRRIASLILDNDRLKIRAKPTVDRLDIIGAAPEPGVQLALLDGPTEKGTRFIGGSLDGQYIETNGKPDTFRRGTQTGKGLDKKTTVEIYKYDPIQDVYLDITNRLKDE